MKLSPDASTLVTPNQTDNSMMPETTSTAPTVFACLGLVKNRITPTIKTVVGIIMNIERDRGNAQVGVMISQSPLSIGSVENLAFFQTL